MEEPVARKMAERGDFLKILIDPDNALRLRPISTTTRTLIVRPPERGTEILVMDLYMKKGAAAWYQASRFERSLGAGGPGIGKPEAEGAAARESHLARTSEDRLDASYPYDPEMQKIVAEYKEWTKKEGRRAALEAGDKNAVPYVGVEACGACHQEQWDNWKTTRHSRAWEALEKDADGGAEDPECIACHVSGFLQPGGPTQIEDAGKFLGVQCESCHAPVKDHPGKGRFPKLTEASCRSCHSESRDPRFEYGLFMKFGTCRNKLAPGADRPPR